MTFPKRTKESLNGLQRMIDYINTKYDTKQCTLLEIGSWVGVSSVLFAKRFKKVICIDPFIKVKKTIADEYNMNDVFNAFKERVKDIENIVHVRHDSNSFFNLVSDSEFDFVYIDGNHHYDQVKEDLINSLKYVKLMITGHDYCDRFPGVKKAVHNCLGAPDKVFSDTSWVWEKTKC